MYSDLLPLNSNQYPPIYDWMSPAEVEFRRKGPENFLKAARMACYDVSDFQAMQLGHASVVYEFSLNDGSRCVCKLSRKDEFTALKQFYDLCASNNVPSLSVLQSIKIDDNLYACFMNYVDARTLSELAEEEIDIAVYEEIGKISAQLHKITGRGFGRPLPTDGLCGENPDFIEMLRDRYLSEELVETAKIKLSPQDIAHVEEAIRYLNNYFEGGGRSCLSHGDISKSNIFYTKPRLTLFDPSDILLSHPMLDLGLTIVYSSTSSRYPEIRQALVKGYSDISQIDHKALSAAILIMAYRKLITAIRKENPKRIEAYLRTFNDERSSFSD